GHEAAEQRAHQRHEHQEREEDRQDLRRIDQRRLLDLGQGLQQADADADDQPHDQDRGGELYRQPDGVAPDVQNLGAAHGKPLGYGGRRDSPAALRGWANYG